MKTLVKMLFVFFFLALCATPTLADTIVNANGLSEEQKAQIQIQIEQLKAKAAQTVTAEKVNEWVDVGKNLGTAITAAAKEVGVAADAFLGTTTGKITMAMIFWKVMGRDAAHILVGLLFFAVFLPLWIYFFRKLCVIKSETYSYPEGKLSGFRKKKTIEYYEPDDSDVKVIRMWFLAIFVAGILLDLMIIFL